MHIPKACYDVAIDGESSMCSTRTVLAPELGPITYPAMSPVVV